MWSSCSEDCNEPKAKDLNLNLLKNDLVIFFIFSTSPMPHLCSQLLECLSIPTPASTPPKLTSFVHSRPRAGDHTQTQTRTSPLSIRCPCSATLASMHLAASASHTIGTKTNAGASPRRTQHTCASVLAPAPQAVARSNNIKNNAPDGYSSVEAYDAERLKLDAQVCVQGRSASSEPHSLIPHRHRRDC